jgi:hypothetical protein
MANYACKVRGCKAAGYRSVGALLSHTNKAHPVIAAKINRKRTAAVAATKATNRKRSAGGLPTRRKTRRKTRRAANPGRTRTALRFCTRCGTHRTRTWKFCGRCGVKLK